MNRQPVTFLILIYSLTLTTCNYDALAKPNYKFTRKENTDKVLGCWKWTLPSRGTVSVTDIHNFKPNNKYLGLREFIGAPFKTDLVYYPGQWLREGDYIIVKDNRRETMTFKFISPDELQMVGTSSLYSRC